MTPHCTVTRMKMFLVLFLATIILPDIILGCCYPWKYTGYAYNSLSRSSHRFLRDYRQNKFITQPLSENKIDFLLYDLNINEFYIKYKTGTCRKFKWLARDDTNRCYYQKVEKLGNGYLGPKDSVSMQIFRIKHSSTREFLNYLTVDKCLPVLTVTKNSKTSSTTIYFNVTDDVTGATDLDLNQDISNCI